MSTHAKIFLLFCTVVSLALGQQNEPQHLCVTDRKVALEWHFIDEYRVWLSANYYGSEFAKEGFCPSYVYLRSTYIPIVKKLKDGSYQITFTSDLTKDLP